MRATPKRLVMMAAHDAGLGYGKHRRFGFRSASCKRGVCRLHKAALSLSLSGIPLVASSQASYACLKID